MTAEDWNTVIDHFFQAAGLFTIGILVFLWFLGFFDKD